MKLGIMQPYFFPYLGYFSLIRNTEKWVVFDDVQFIRHGWIERNRVLKPDRGWQYISVPLRKHPREAKINEIEIRTDEPWAGRIFRQLEHYRKRAPYFRETIQLLESAFATEHLSIVELNVTCLQLVCNKLGIRFEYEIFSRMNLGIGSPLHPGAWALSISRALNADEYVNPIGGAAIFRPDEFQEAGIKLSFLKYKLPQYHQRREDFETGLSVIDALMFNDSNRILELIDDYQIEHL